MSSPFAVRKEAVGYRFRGVSAYGMLVVIIALGLGLLYRVMDDSGLLALVLDGEKLQQTVAALGFWCPLAVIGLMTVAIVLNPIPSAPIAPASGAAFGCSWDTLYTMS